MSVDSAREQAARLSLSRPLILWWSLLAIVGGATVAGAALGLVSVAIAGPLIFLIVGLRAGLSPLSWLLVFVVGRSLSDATVLTQTGSLAINATMAVAIGVIALKLIIQRSVGRMVVAWVALGVVGVWTVLSALTFGINASYLNDAARFVSIVLIAIIARAAVRQAGSERMLHALVWATVPALALVGIAAATRWTWLMSESLRPMGTFGHPNGSAAFAALAALLAVHLLLRTRTLIYLVPLGFATIAVFVTESRGGQVALAAGLAWLILRGGKLYGRFARVAAILIIVPAAALLAVLTGVTSRWSEIFGSDLGSSISGIPDGSNSFVWRIANWYRFLAVWQERPVQGWGFGTTSDILNPIGQMPHNEYVRLLVETGIIGILIAIVVCVFSVMGIRRRLLVADPSTYVLLTSALVLILANALGANTISYVPTMFLFVSLWALGSVPPDAPTHADRTVEPPARELP